MATAAQGKRRGDAGPPSEYLHDVVSALTVPAGEHRSPFPQRMDRKPRTTKRGRGDAVDGSEKKDDKREELHNVAPAPPYRARSEADDSIGSSPEENDSMSTSESGDDSTCP